MKKKTIIAQLIVSGLPTNLRQTPDQVADTILEHLGLDQRFIGCHKANARRVNLKRSQPTTASIIIRMLSHDARDIVLEAAARKRRTSKLLVRDILGGKGEVVFYINKMQSTYIANLAYQAREAKKRLRWRSTWTNNGIVYVKTSDQSSAIAISLLSQLEALTK